jgi:hemoglobin
MVEKADYDTSVFEILGGVEGIRALANSFHDIVEVEPEARRIRDMHPKNLEPTR